MDPSEKRIIEKREYINFLATFLNAMIVFGPFRDHISTELQKRIIFFMIELGLPFGRLQRAFDSDFFTKDEIKFLSPERELLSHDWLDILTKNRHHSLFQDSANPHIQKMIQKKTSIPPKQELQSKSSSSSHRPSSRPSAFSKAPQYGYSICDIICDSCSIM